MLDVSLDLIRASVSAAAFAAGQAYWRDGRVRELALDADKGRIVSSVKGSAKAPYRQHIQLRKRGGLTTVEGECTCPVGFNCKHVAAALLAQKQKETSAAGPRAPLRVTPEPDLPAPARPVLTPQLSAWLNALANDAAADSEAYPDNVTKRIFYVLTAVQDYATGLPHLKIVAALGELKKDGGVSPRHTTPSAHQLLHTVPLPGYLRPADRAILRQLQGDRLDERLADPAQLVRDIVATNRARIGEFPGIEAQLGAPRDALLDWQMEDDGSQKPVLQAAGDAAPVLIPAPWYLDGVTGEVGPLVSETSPLVLRRLLGAPSVGADQAVAVRAALQSALPGVRVPAPRELPHGGVLDGPVVPHLHLKRLALPYQDAEDRLGGAAAVLKFKYGPVLTDADATATERVQGGMRYTLQRNARAEKAVSTSLGDLGFQKLRRVMPYGAPAEAMNMHVLVSSNPDALWMDFMLDRLPGLQEAGWDIRIDSDFPFRLIAPTGDMQAALKEGSGIDWFDLELGVLVGNERIDLVGPLAALLTSASGARVVKEMREREDVEGRKLVLPLRDGRRLVLELTTLRPMLLTLLDLFSAGGISERDGKFGVTRSGAADMAALESAGLAAGLVWRGGEALRALGKLLQQRGGVSQAVVPAWFNAELRPYQQRGVDWLQFLREAGLAGVLADDMGLGKTVQALAHLAIEKQAGRLNTPALVICPTSVVGNWAREAERFAPTLRVLPLQGTDRKTRFGDIAHSDIVISTYPLLARDDEVLMDQHWHTLILDEAQTVKNPAATMAQTVRQLRANQRICLTGTPMENHLGELWALFDFMMPGFLGSAQEFGRRFRAPIEKGGDSVLHAALAKRVSPFLLRRNKAEVATELPPRTDIVETVQMQTAQRGVYEAIRLAMHARVQQAIAEHGMAKSGIVILDALLKMRQACCDPRLLKIAGATKQKAGSAKLERLLELVTTLREEGRSILLFSQFTSMLALIEEALAEQNIRYSLLTGQTKNRTSQVDDFQSGRTKLFLISLKAGGVGLNLTAADTVIHYDPWWNPAVENQATDRAHRIGQTKSVFVHRLITENSIEEKMEVLKARKSALAEGILSGAGASALKMTEDDVEMLFT